MERFELERALEALHGECWGWALACCGHDRDAAEEVLQTAYCRMLSGRARFGSGSKLKTWVFGVIRVTSLEELRRRRRVASREVAPIAGMDVADPARGADENIEREEMQESLVRAMSALSPRQREVLHLVFYHGMTIQEAATIMTVSLGSARTHYERGKQALARALTTQGDR